MQSLTLNWLDIAIIAVLGLGAYIGYRRGLIITVFNTAGVLAGLVLARFITSPVSDFLIKNTSLHETILNIIIKKMDSLSPMTLAAFKLANIDDAAAAEILAGTVMSGIVFLLAFVIAMIALSLLKHTLKEIADKTPVGAVDKLGGAAIGFIMSAIFVFVFFAVIAPFSGVAANGTVLIDAISTSRLAKYFYLYNFIIPWIENINSIKL